MTTVAEQFPQVVTKVVFQPRQMMITLDDGTPWPLRPHPAIIRYVEQLATEVEDLRTAAAELAELRLYAERAGHSPMEFLTGLVSKIERLTETVQAAQETADQQIAALRTELVTATATGERDAMLLALKIVRTHCQTCPVEAATVLGPVTSQLSDQVSAIQRRLQ